jgi:hypothetical protein
MKAGKPNEKPLQFKAALSNYIHTMEDRTVKNNWSDVDAASSSQIS